MNRSLLTVVVLLASLAVFPADLSAQTSAGEIVGTPATGAPGITVSVQEIMARELLQPTAPFTGVMKEKDEFPMRPTPSFDPFAPMVSSWPPVDVTKTPAPRESFLNPQTVGTSFLAIQASESPYVPPDCGADVGPTQILVHLNGRIKVFSKTGVLGALNATDDTFWLSVAAAAGESDPHIRYDRLSKRWIVVAINTAASNNRVMIAVSSDSVITGAASFTFFQFAMNTGGGGTSDNGGFADYPTLGVDANALYIGLNIFNASGTSVLGTTGFVVRKSSVFAGPIVYTAFRQLSNGNATTGVGPWTPQGVDNDDPASTEGYFIGVDFVNFSKLDVRRISTPGGTPTISGNLAITVPATAYPVLQPHLGATNGTRRLDALDDRLFAAQLKKNKLTGVATLWTAHNIGVNASGVADTAASARNGSRWYQIGSMTTTPALLQSGTLYDPGASNPRGYWIPTVAMSGQGHMAIGTSYAGLADHAGVAVAGRLSSDVSGTTQGPTIALASGFAYNAEAKDGQRWGDYSSTVVDPNDDMTLWTFQEYANAANSWGMQAVQLRAPLPAAPTSALPGTIVAGASNVSVTITGTSSGGTGFFDPGAGYTGRINASVGGAGVTVNSVTFTNPTSIVLNVTVAPGATAGARTVTVTNPDGQLATSATGILTVSGVSCPTITLSPSTLPAGAAGSAYTQSITASGGLAPYTYAVTVGALPAGVTLSGGGLLSGTPTFGGTYNFSVTATDANFCTGVQAYVWTVSGCPQITIAPATLPNDTIGIAYSQSVTASGGTGPYTYIVSAGSLPSGLSLSTGGAITGTPTATGTSNFTVRATDANTCQGTQAYSVQTFCPLLSLAPATLPSDTIGKSYTQPVTATGGTPSYTYAVSAGALPTGLTLSPGGVLSGTLTATGVFSFTVQATDGIACTGTRAYSVTVYAVFVPNTISLAAQGTAVTENFDALANSLTSSTLPTGWFLAETGTAANTTYAADNGATTAGNTYSYGATSASERAFGMLQSGSLVPTIGASVTNNTGATITSLAVSYVGEEWRLGTLSRADSLRFQMSLDATSITTGTWTNYTQLNFATPTFTGTTGAKDGNAAGFRTPVGATLTGLSIPNGAAFFIRWSDFNATGADDGLAVDSFAITANPGAGSPTNPTASGASSPSSVVVGNTSLLTVAVTPGTNPASTGISVKTDLSSVGGSATQSFFDDGTHGDAAIGDNTWTFRDTVSLATTPGVKSLPVTVTDAQVRSGAASIGLTVLACPAITLLPASLPGAGLGVAYTQTVTASNGATPYVFTLQTPGTLPAGLALSSGGSITGTPTAPGTSNFTVVVTDSNNCTASIAYSVLVACPTITVTPASLPAATVSAPYNQAVLASGGKTPYGFALQTPNTLPAGLSLSALGVVSGTPTAVGLSNFTVVVTDSNGCTATKSYSIAVNCPTITITPATLAGGSVGAAYSHSVSGGGGTPPYTFTIHSGALPPGLALASTGSITGTPTANGTFNATIQAADSNGCSDSLAYAVTIGCPTITLAPASLGAGTVGTAYSQLVSASGGTGPYAYAVTFGSLPAGCTLSVAGLLSGTPATSGPSLFTVTATDSLGCQGSRAYSLPVSCPVISMNPATLPNGTKGAVYSQPLSGTGGRPPYTFQVTSATPPVGITLSAAGLLSGTPTATGSSPFTVTATDSFGCTGSRPYTLQIDCPAVSVNPATLADDSVAHAISRTITASGGTAPYSFAITAGALPPGVTLSPGGLLAGIVPAAGTYNFTITATGADACGGSRVYSWQINVSSQVLVSVPLQAKWNIVSNPLTGGNDSAAAVYPTAVAGAYAFIPGTGYSATPLIPHGAGYWIKFGASQTATLIGFPVMSDSVPVAAGWNLIGAVAEKIPAGSVVPLGTTIASQFYGYAGGYVPADSLVPGLGYWVNVGTAGSLLFSTTVDLSVASPRTSAEVSPAATLVISDAAGNSQQLLLGRKGSDVDPKLFALPPPPPKGVFDVRYSSDRMLEVVTGRRQELSIRVASAVAPVTVRWTRQGDDDARMVLTATDGARTPLRTELQNEGSLTLRSAQNLRLVLEPKRVVPTSFALLQNYPNPFNPVTTIQFDLPVRASVTLSVLNILGEEVARLHDRSDLGPGREDISWDASSLSSGIYFYRLSARPLGADGAAAGAPFTSTKKMILVK